MRRRASGPLEPTPAGRSATRLRLRRAERGGTRHVAPRRASAPSLRYVPETEFATTLVVLDLVGIFVFAVTGALVAVRKNLDLFAALVLGGVTGPRRRLHPRRADRRHPAGRARRLALPARPGRRRPADLRLPPDRSAASSGWSRSSTPSGSRSSASPARSRRSTTASARCRPRCSGMVTGIGGGMIRDVLAGGVPVDLRGRPLRHPGAGRCRGRGPAGPGRPAARRGRGGRASAPASAGGCSRWSAAGRRRCPRGRPTSEPGGRQSPSTRRR